MRERDSCACDTTRGDKGYRRATNVFPRRRDLPTKNDPLRVATLSKPFRREDPQRTTYTWPSRAASSLWNYFQASVIHERWSLESIDAVGLSLGIQTTNRKKCFGLTLFDRKEPLVVFFVTDGRRWIFGRWRISSC